MTLAPPIPKRLAIAAISIKTGMLTESAATIAALPVLPTYQVSAKLYIILMSCVMMVGTASVMTATGIGADSKTARSRDLLPV